jgi:hypothetical protein
VVIVIKSKCGLGFLAHIFIQKNMKNEKQLQDHIVAARYSNQWKDNIKNRYDNPTEIFLDELFNNWQD